MLGYLNFIINWFTEATATGTLKKQMSDNDSIMGECSSKTMEDSPYVSQDYLLCSELNDVSTTAVILSSSRAGARGCVRNEMLSEKRFL
jgi:hypothetical protein